MFSFNRCAKIKEEKYLTNSSGEKWFWKSRKIKKMHNLARLTYEVSDWRKTPQIKVLKGHLQIERCRLDFRRKRSTLFFGDKLKWISEKNFIFAFFGIFNLSDFWSKDPNQKDSCWENVFWRLRLLWENSNSSFQIAWNWLHFLAALTYKVLDAKNKTECNTIRKPSEGENMRSRSL